MFVNKYPHYILSKGETDILIAISQLLPRILEQSLLVNYSFVLNGRDKLVRFTYTNWNSNALSLPVIRDKVSKVINIVIDKKVVKIVDSIQKLLPVLGIKSRNTIFKYMNHVKGLYSPTYGKLVNIRYPYVQTLLNHEIVHRKVKNVPELVLPNISLNSLDLNKLYVYDDNFLYINTFNSIKEAVLNLNPNHKNLGISVRGGEVAISRGKNKQILVSNEKGSFYFAENPNTNR